MTRSADKPTTAAKGPRPARHEPGRAERRYRLLADSMADVITSIRLDGSSDYISPGIERLLGYKPREMARRPAQTFVHPDDRAMVLQAFTDLAGGADRRILQHRCLHKAGHAVWVETSLQLVREAAGQPAEFVAVIRDNTQQKRQEDELVRAREAAEELTRRADAAEAVAGLGHWRLDARTFEVDWSPQMYRIYGLDPAQPLDLEALMAMTHPEDAARARESLARQLADGEGEEATETRIINAKGELRYMEGRSRVERDATGAISAVVGVLTDVTEQRLIQMALAESELRYRTLAEHSTDILVRCGRDGLLRYVSPAIRALGYTPEELSGQPVLSIVAPEHLAQSAAVLEELFGAEALDPSVQHEHCVLDKAGAPVWLEGRPSQLRDADGQVVEIITVLRDVTARRAIKAALAESEARHRRLADTAPDIITESALDATLTYVSSASLAITGFAPEELVGRSSLSLMNDEDAARMLAMCRAVHASDGALAPWPIQFRTTRKDGQEIWLESKPVFYRDSAGRFAGLTDVVRDVTAHKALEASLEQARAEAESAAAVKAEFLANMSHELRTPLTAVLGFSRLVAEQPELTPATRGYVQRLTTAGKALMSTVNDILDFSKLEAGQVEIHKVPTEPAAVIAEAVALLETTADDKEIGLVTLGLENLPPTLSLDPDRLRQILLNLVGNAVKFTATGQVTVAADWDAAGQILSCRVIDTGPGIPPDKLLRLFQRFSQVDASSTRQHGGTGLGLAICKGLVEAMGGVIGASSRPGEGSVFQFTLPAVAVEASDDGGDPSVSGGLPIGSRILVTDDSPVNRELVRAILSTCDVELTEAGDGAQAVALARAQPFDLILMDLRMPVMDGETAARAIRAEPGPNAGVPIVGFTADASLTAGGLFDAVVGKPIEAGRLLGVLAELLCDDDPEADYAAA
ncbi:PAS domain S-box-containing protein [Caulobacter ginsengisoli]|uniref:histidine kinase n=1 Tax=Caulobacter ginsengisoli TaxID=400775 RepID=A0ABU0IRJ0_9CAUL|nr:PAS domain S-box protein [Caulobacter ginsengisoli]MDQ0464628.1 PAS domain S-box-containing protein [Caulobacter ginsengisoli]